MLANQSILSTTALQSPIAANSYVEPTQGKHKRGIVADLLLTALIDAFSILVIFLLMSFSSTGDLLDIGKGMELPKASLGEVLERNPVVKIDEGKIFLESQPVEVDGLVAAFLDLRNKYNETHPGEEYPGILTVQADRRVKYEFLNQIVLAAAHSGFSDIRFAVLMK